MRSSAGIAYLTLEAGFLEFALDAGFLTVEAGFADARDAGFVAFDAGFSDVALDSGLAAALEAGLACHATAGKPPVPPTHEWSKRTFLDGGASSAGAAGGSAGSSASLSMEVRFLPLVDFGLGASVDSSTDSLASPSFSSAGLAFFARGLAAFFVGSSTFGCSFMREERRGSAGASVAGGAVALRGMGRMGKGGGICGGSVSRETRLTLLRLNFINALWINKQNSIT